MAKKKTKKKQEFTTYSNLAKSQGRSKREIRREFRKRQRAEDLATLPKNPFLRFFARLHPKRVFKYWFSMRGLRMIGKIAGVSILVLAIIAGSLYFYFRRELAGLSLEELLRRAEMDTVSIYYDRHGEEIWRDFGVGDYRLVVRSDQIHEYIKQATIAIEDQDFFEHSGISYRGIMRALLNNIFGNSDQIQGGSTLTQQLIKQVFFADQAHERGIRGIPRKIQEAILALEAERMFDKSQILTAYLNVSPYGGRRNGVESAAQTYFGHSALNLGCEVEKIRDEYGNNVENCLNRDRSLALAQAALLAGIPQSPTLFNPYNVEGNPALIARQHAVLGNMVRMGFITQEESDLAREIPILERILPLHDQMRDSRAPHFVQMVRDDLIRELGPSVVGQGGLRIVTSLDLRVQEVIDREVENLFNTNTPINMGFNNASVVMVDNPTGQILGLRGSRDYHFPDYGAVNSATAFIQPGSSIKQLVFASLIDNQENPNGTFGAGSIIADTPIPQSVYQTDGGTSVQNADRRFKGNISIRQSLGESRNIPAIRAMAIDGHERNLQVMRSMGVHTYCTDGVDRYAGLAASMGACGVRQTELTNATATLARGGVYRPVTSILKVTNSDGEALYEWQDEGISVIDPQTAFLINDILGDAAAKRGTFGNLLDSSHNMPGGIRAAVKTGTSDIGGRARDFWMVSYTPRATLSVWWGNHIPTPLRAGFSSDLRGIVNDISVPIYNDIFRNDGTWSPGDWFTQPQGIQRLTVNGINDLFPSWFNRNQRISQTVTLTFNKVSRKLANECTPPAARKDINVIRNIDPITNQVTITAPEGWDPDNYDDFHSCYDVPPFVISAITATPVGGGMFDIQVSVRQGTHPVTGVIISLNGNSYNARFNGIAWEIRVAGLSGTISVHAIATDQGLYTGEVTQNVLFDSGDPNGSSGGSGGNGP